MLRYYTVKEAPSSVTRSQFGLRAALMQNGQLLAYASRALTEAETRYAQIEKELLAIVFACEHFEYYVYGREVVNVETDHQSLVPIVLKPLNKAPNRLQRMLLRLQSFNLKVVYKKGQDMFLADTLSRVFLPEVNTSDFVLSLEEVDHTTMTLAIPENQLQELKQVAGQDPVSQALSSTVRQGWPDSKSEVTELVHPNFDIRDELTVQDELVFKGTQLVIPRSLREKMMEVIHETHIGIDGCLRRVRECMYWPRMSTELKEYISKCDTCLLYRPEQSQEPLTQHQFAARPWNKVGVDLCELNGRTLLVVTDYFSNYIEVENLNKTT